MSVWSDCLLGDIANFRNGRSSPARTDSGALPVFGSNGVIGFSEKINAEPGTSIIGRVGSYCGSVYYSETACWVTDNAIAGEPKEAKADGRFLYYLLKRLDLNRAAQGSGQPLLNQSILNSIELTVPSDVGEQETIAEILSSLDEKIELNRKQNRALEAIAQALFKRWFVEFEFPDENGRPYKSGGGSMQPSELGEIPVGWEVVPFSETVELIGGGTPKTSVPEYWDGEIPWFSVVDAPNGSDTYVIDTEKKVTQEGVINSSTKILRIGTTIVSARGTVGRLALVGTPMAMNQSCYGVQGLFEGSDSFTYLALQRAIGALQASAHGSVFDTITRQTFDNYRVVRPGEQVVYDFEELITPLFQKILANCVQTVSLSRTRDTLLPKLMSGELRVA